MGKTEKNIKKAREEDGMLKFDVLVRVHGNRPHTERYGIPTSQVSLAKSLGYLDESGENRVYYDWKPLFYNTKEFPGGVFDVHHYSFDDKYAYAHTSPDRGADFSLPKYLFDKMGERSKIMIGKRLDK